MGTLWDAQTVASTADQKVVRWDWNSVVLLVEQKVVKMVDWWVYCWVDLMAVSKEFCWADQRVEH